MGINSYGEAWHVNLPDDFDNGRFYLESELERIDRVLSRAYDIIKNRQHTLDEGRKVIMMIHDLYNDTNRILSQMYPSYSIKHCLPNDDDKNETKEETNG